MTNQGQTKEQWSDGDGGKIIKSVDRYRVILADAALVNRLVDQRDEAEHALVTAREALADIERMLRLLDGGIITWSLVEQVRMRGTAALAALEEAK